MTEETDAERLERVAHYIDASFNGDGRADFKWVVGLARRWLESGPPIARYREGLLPAAKLDAIETRAREATSGPWQTHENDGIEVLYADWDVDEEGKPFAYPYTVCHCTHTKMDADAAHIAGMDPPTTLALVAMARDSLRHKIAPQPDLKTLYTPRVVDCPDGHSEFMLEDVPAFWQGEYDGERGHGVAVAWARDDGRFVGVRWPTRELPAPQPDAAPEPVAWWLVQVPSEARPRLYRGDRLADAQQAEWASAQAGYVVTALYAAPPAPVPAGEVVEFLQELTLCDGSPANVANAEVLAAHIRSGAKKALVALTAARPRADAGEVTEPMVNAAIRAFNCGYGGIEASNMRGALRAALAAVDARACVEAVNAQGWRTMESAPRDGTWFLACSTANGWECTRLVRFDAEDDRLPIGEKAGALWPSAPTHWMPIPAPPQVRP